MADCSSSSEEVEYDSCESDDEKVVVKTVTVVPRVKRRVKSWNSSELCMDDNIRTYGLNRVLDEKHSLILKKGIKENGYVQGIITIAQIGDKKYILNGQHRYRALKKLLEENFRIDKISVEIYYVKKKADLIRLYNESNCLVKEGAFKISTIVANVIGKLMDRFPTEIRQSNRNKNYIDSRVLREALERIFNTFNPDDMFKHICDFNDEMLLRPNKNLLKLTKRKTFTNVKIDLYKRQGFILGIDDEFQFLKDIKKNYY